MKANFALTLSFKGIRLLHRAAGGWRFVGEVALDDSDLDGALAALRRTALELEPSGLRTKLVLPGTQIRYLTIDTADTDADDLRAAAETALDGATPYPVSELVFDLSPDGERTHIAAVARETLAEAESFAIEHRFAPISVVGMQDGEAFLGEPFFGATEYALRVLGPDQTVEPDGIAVVELGPIDWPDGPVVAVSEDTPVAGNEPAPSAGTMPLVSEWEASDKVGDGDHASLEPGPTTTERADEAEADTELPAAPRSIGFASRRRSGSTAAPKLGGVTRRFEPIMSTTPDSSEGSPKVADSDAATREPAVTTPGSPEAEPPSFPDDVPDPPPAVVAAFLSRRKLQVVEHDPRKDKTAKPTPPAKPAATHAGSDRPLEQQDAGVLSMAFAAMRAQPEFSPQRVPRPKSELQRMTVFGAREREATGALAVDGKPRYMGLVLTAMLLLFLAGVAAWAAVFIDSGISRFFAPRTPEAPVTAEELAPEPETDSASPAETEQAAIPEPPTGTMSPSEGTPPQDSQPDPDILNASLDSGSLAGNAVEPDPDGLAEPEGPKPFDPVEAEAQYAVTGIWTIPPVVPSAPALVDVEDLYVTSIDPPGESFDAVALLPDASFGTDRAPLAPANPAPAGTTFDLDDRGLVIPTPEGAMSPDGILVFSGSPPVVPPDTPRRAEEASGAIDPAIQRELKRFRPRARPGDLIEKTERQQLGGLSRSELAEYRPRLRPETVKQAEEKDETPTAQAVANSLRPSHRPSNFPQLVARAVARNLKPVTAEPSGGPGSNDRAEEVASVAPRTVAPSIPSRSSVTKEATVRNAINLKRINLMGVYGTPSNRRALVRLSNGRYKKVKVGDRIDGGRVSAISDNELSYVKGRRSIVLKMPRT